MWSWSFCTTKQWQLSLYTLKTHLVVKAKISSDYKWWKKRNFMTIDTVEGTAIAVMNMNISNDRKSPDMPGSYKLQNVSEWGVILHGTEESKVLHAKTFWSCSPICTTPAKLFIYANNKLLRHHAHDYILKDYLLTDSTYMQGKEVYTNSTTFYVQELTVTISSHPTSSRIHS